MRTPLVLSLLLVPALTSAQALNNAPGPSNIMVSAFHSVRVTANRASLYFLVEGTGETSELALQRLAEKAQAVRRAIASGGLAAAPIEEFSYGIAATPNNTGVPWPANVIPLTARSAIRVQLTRLDQLPALVSSALTAGATSISHPQFEFTGTDTLRQALLPAALQKARRDAESLARGLTGQLGEVLQVSTYSPGAPQAGQPYINFMSRYDSGGQAAIPELNITASVTVYYRFIPRS